MPIDDVPEHDGEDLTTVQGLLAALRAQHNSNLALDPVVAPALPRPLPQAHRQSQSQTEPEPEPKPDRFSKMGNYKSLIS